MKLIVLMVCFFILSAPVSSAALCVKATVANVRSGPGTRYEKIWQVDRFMPLEKIGLSLAGNWYAVRDVDGDVYWIHKSLLTGAYRCAVVKSEVVNVRTGPGTNYRKKFSEPAGMYDSFRVLEKRGVWIKVRDVFNNTGWIHRDYLWVR